MGMIACLLRVNNDTLNAYLEDSLLLEERVYSEDDFNDGSELIDIDKSWDAILFLLSGEERYQGPLSKVLFSGKFIDDEQDFGYGPAHFLYPDEVSALNGEISKISKEQFISRFDADKMNEIGVYPEWDASEENLDYLSEAFQEIKDLYANATAKGQGIICYLS